MINFSNRFLNIKAIKNEAKKNFVVKDSVNISATKICKKYMWLKKAETLYLRFFVYHVNKECICTVQYVKKIYLVNCPRKLQHF